MIRERGRAVSGLLCGNPDRRSAEKVKSIAVLSVTSLLLFLIHLLLAPFNVADNAGPWLDTDYGILTHNALQLLEGKALYEEVWSLYTPAATYVVALLFKFFGDSLWTLRVALSLTGAFTSILVFLLVRSLASTTWALAAAALSILVGPVCVNFPYPSWFCVPLGLSMVWLAHAGWNRRSSACYLAAGLIAGAMFSFKMNWGLFALSALFFTQLLEAPLRADGADSLARKKAPLALLTMAFVSVPAASMLLIRNHFTSRTVLLFSLPALAVGAVGAMLFAGRRENGERARIAFWPTACSLIGFTVAVGPWAIYFLAELGASGFHKALIFPLTVFSDRIHASLPPFTVENGLLMFVCAFQGALFLRKRRSTEIWMFLLLLWTLEALLFYRMVGLLRETLLATENRLYHRGVYGIVCYLPPAVHVGVAFLLMRDFLTLDTVDRKKFHLLMALWVYSVAAFHTFYPVTEVFHLLWNMTPVIALGGVFLYRSLKAWNTGAVSALPSLSRAARFLTVAPVPLMVALFFGLPMLKLFVEIDASPLRVSLTRFADLDTPRAGILMPRRKAAQMNGAIRYIRSHTAPDEYILDATGSLFYFLTDRPNPLRFGHFVEAFLSHQDIAEAMRALERRRPEVAVSSYAADLHLSLNQPSLYKYIHSSFTPARTFGDYRVLSRRDAEGAADSVP